MAGAGRSGIADGAMLLVTSVLGGRNAGAQTATATTGVVSGTINGCHRRRVPGVTVVLTDTNTNGTRETVSSESGHYSFISVLPGRYRVTASLQGFQQTNISDLAVEVNKILAVNVTLAVGNLPETIEVSAGAAVALQINDSTIVNTLSEETVQRLPNPARSLEVIQFNQPLAVPYTAGADSNRNRVRDRLPARAPTRTPTRSTAWTSPTTSSATTSSSRCRRPIVPLPTESIEEFSAASTNANATFGRGSGAQFVVVTKRGTQPVFADRPTGIARTTRSTRPAGIAARLGQPNPPLKDNRAGFSLGGPIVPDKTFFFTNYEARRFPRTTQVSADGAHREPQGRHPAVPRCGRQCRISYNLRALDPRGIGLNPVVSSLWDLLPNGNDPSRGDGFNTTGFTAEADTSFNSDAVVSPAGSQLLEHAGAWTATTDSAASARSAPRRPTSAGCCRATRKRRAGGNRRSAARAAFCCRRRDRAIVAATARGQPLLLREGIPRLHARESLRAGARDQCRARHRRHGAGRAARRRHRERALAGRQLAQLPVREQLDADAATSTRCSSAEPGGVSIGTSSATNSSADR